ncbi:hypothetical protein ACFYQA_02260 [Streptomyces sp. NPDC005774]|uniref:hypothetical protein n=1 Tax=Streptomyces sp. NPDC005774 TaxID=3364728 RepID=UPI0036A8C250
MTEERGGCMEAGRGSRQRVWYFFSDDLPEDEIFMPIRNEHGLAFAVRPNSGMDQAMLDRLNEAADHVISVGLAQLNISQGKPPE